jgi:sulfur transfer complex TusBCD TusB component (DsrH family)
MNENAFIKIGEIRKYIVKKYGLDTKIRTKNNIIYKNDDIVLIENVVTGDLKIKKNTR